MLRNIINPLCGVSHTSDTPPIRVKDSHGLITKHCMIIPFCGGRLLILKFVSRVWPLRVIKIQSEKNAPKLKVINTVFSERGHRRNYMFNLLQTLRNKNILWAFSNAIMLGKIASLSRQ